MASGTPFPGVPDACIALPVKAAAPLLFVSLILVQCLPGCLLVAYCVDKILQRFKSKRGQNHMEPAQIPVAQTLEGITDNRLQTLCNQFNSQWERTMKLIEEDQLAKERAAERAASAVECSCCFEEVPIDDMVACRDEGHLFCSTCLQTYVENQVFGNGNLGVSRVTKKLVLELECFHGDGCSSDFDGAFLEKALPSRVLGKLNEVQGQVNIEQAGLANVLKCPKCSFKAVLDTAQKVFSCPVESCQFVSCRYCGEVSHIPLPCEQAKKQTKGRLTVEEAMSAAIIRKCPNCKQEFVKFAGGCNKVRCGCGTEVCYLCRKAIRGYEHFCRTPLCTHARCGKCRLFTNNDEDDARARREAGRAAAAKRFWRFKFRGWGASKQDMDLVDGI
jgi:TRIAD3 protein (E3 ubiquitin-protein ligase RNF216)